MMSCGLRICLVILAEAFDDRSFHEKMGYEQ